MRFEEYRERFEHVQLERSDGVLQMTLHSGGGSLVWGTGPHRELPLAFAAIGSDPDNRVVVLTGAGESFCADRDESLSALRSSPQGWNRIYWEGKHLIDALLGIEVPIVGAVNGPAFHHAELIVLSDIVIAAESAAFRDHGHFASGVVPGDGVQVIWPLILGPNRGRYFLLTGQTLTAAEALSLGIVSEILPREGLLARAHELAADIARRSVLATRYTRVVLADRIRRAMAEGVGYGLALEGLALLSESDDTQGTGQ
jgi:enoyl-CoA hydratase/carnithine racemase